MTRRVAVRVGTRTEAEANGPRPFSSEWHATPPELRTPQGRRRRDLPAWVPAPPIVTGLLVLLLVLTTSIVSGSLAPVTTARVNGSAATAIAAPTKPAESAQVIVPPAEQTATAEPTLIPTPTQAPAETTSVPQIDVTPAVNTPPASSDPRAILPNYRIVAFYGHPADPNMGILGEYDMEELYTRLMDQVAEYEAADPSRPVMPAFEVIASVAQNWPADNDTWLLHTSSDTIQKYVDFTREKGIMLILDLQIGHSSVPAEMDMVREWLYEPHVHLAIDPEFSMAEDEIPGQAIGGVHADEVAYAQAELAKIVTEYDLPPKVLVVHQFEENMIMEADQIKVVDGVQLVIDFDGWGAPSNKLSGYALFLRKPYVQFAGIKLFYRQDDPLLTAEDVVSLDPVPDYVQYA